MEQQNLTSKNPRRDFIAKCTAGAAALGIGVLSSPFNASATERHEAGSPDAWFENIKGKHRMLFDCTRPNEMMPFAWPKVFLMSNAGTGTPESDCSVVVVLRHNAIGYALNDAIWAKYKLGEMFKADDPLTKAPAIRNPFWQPKAGDFKVPGIGPVNIGINELQASGVMFCACDMAITVNSAVAAQKTNQDAATVKKEWEEALLPGVQLVPSGVWAVGRAQEHGCSYCFAG